MHSPFSYYHPAQAKMCFCIFAEAVAGADDFPVEKELRFVQNEDINIRVQVIAITDADLFARLDFL